MNQRNHYKKLEVIFDIIELATINVDRLHVFIDFSGHVNEFSMHVNSADTSYRDELSPVRLMRGDVYLHKKDALKELREIKAKLIELIAQVKSDRQEVA